MLKEKTKLYLGHQLFAVVLGGAYGLEQANRGGGAHGFQGDVPQRVRFDRGGMNTVLDVNPHSDGGVQDLLNREFWIIIANTRIG